MPEIDLIPEIYYQPLDPYHHYFDNLPLHNIITRQGIINSATDRNSQILRESVGTQGTLSNRLAQSMDDDGSIKVEAIDSILHSIAYHSEGQKTLTDDEIAYFTSLGYIVSNPVDYVIMTLAERDKLALISSSASALTLQVETPSSTALFVNEEVFLRNSDTVTWEVSANEITANFAFPAEAAHQHFYNLVPVHANLVTPDYINYKVNSVATPYASGSLRVYINGTRLNSSEDVYVMPATGPDGTWVLTSYTEDYDNGLFALNRAITSSDIIRIDFDQNF